MTSTIRRFVLLPLLLWSVLAVLISPAPALAGDWAIEISYVGVATFDINGGAGNSAAVGRVGALPAFLFSDNTVDLSTLGSDSTTANDYLISELVLDTTLASGTGDTRMDLEEDPQSTAAPARAVCKLTWQGSGSAPSTVTVWYRRTLDVTASTESDDSTTADAFAQGWLATEGKSDPEFDLDASAASSSTLDPEYDTDGDTDADYIEETFPVIDGEAEIVILLSGDKVVSGMTTTFDTKILETATNNNGANAAHSIFDFLFEIHTVDPNP